MTVDVDNLPVLSDRAEDQGAWKSFGLCFDFHDPNMWFPDRGADLRPAKKVCSVCPVRMACLAFALRRGERHGVWGGLSERERRRLRRGLPLTVACRFCGHQVKAGRLGQVTCNRQTCKQALRLETPTVQMVLVFETPTTIISIAERILEGAAVVAVPADTDRLAVSAAS